jgi:hypothetical protein
MQLRVVVDDVRFMVTKAAEPKLDFDTHAQKVDKRSGALLWQVQLMALDDTGGDILTVVVDTQLPFKVGEYVQVEDLVALPWSQGERSGVAFRAAKIGPIPASKPAEPGRPAEPGKAA